MAQYCGDCRGALNSPVEMEVVKSRYTYAIYQCPMCTGSRQVDLQSPGVMRARNITQAEAQHTAPASNSAALVEILLTIKGLLGR